MVQRKYLIFIIIIFYHQVSLTSAWLPTQGNFKYSFSTLTSNSASSSLKHQRARAFSKIEQEIFELLNQKILISSLSDTINPLLMTLIDEEVARLTRNLYELSSYIDSQIITQNIEYGITSQSSCGIKILDQKQKFINSNYIRIKEFNISKRADIYYKSQIYKKSPYIFTISPQISTKRLRQFKEETYLSMTLLTGYSQKIKHRNVFIETAFNFGRGITKSCRGRSFYTMATTQGVKLKHGITVSNYTEYKYNRNYGVIYQKTLFEQLAISQEIINTRFKEFSLQLGYFWDTSLIKPSYYNSGFVFTVTLGL